MKAFAKRTALLVVLVALAITWVAVMGSLDFSKQGGAVGADGSQAEVTYIDESEFPRITAYLSVIDGSSQPLIELGEEAFTLTEDGVPVEIEAFIGAGFQPVTAVLLIDHSGSMEGSKMQGAQEAAKAFLANLQDGRDRIGVTAFNHQESLLYALTLISAADRAALNAQIDQLYADGGTAYYDAVYSAVAELQGQSGRKVVIALTDGIDENSRRSLNSAIQFAQENKVPIYTIGLGRDVKESVLEKMAQQTGGRYYFSPEASQLAALYEDLAHALQGEYSLTYTSPTPRQDGTRRDVAVTVEHPGATVSTVDDYTVGGILAPTINWPLFAVLLLGLLFLLLTPGLVGGLVKRRQPAPAQPPPVGQVSIPAAKPGVPQPHQCPHCGHALRAEARFCSGCGQTLVPAGPTTCLRCGRSLRPGARFCSGCGQTL